MSNPAVVRPESRPLSASRLDGIVPGVPGRRAFPIRGLRNADPFLMLDHVGPGRLARPLNGAPHPHRGFETVSIFLAGSTEHIDSLGNRTRIEAGDLQVMNAGRGIIHGGEMRGDPDTGRFHEFQLWLNLPAALKMSPPSVQNVRASQIPVLREDGHQLRVLSGEIAGKTAPTVTTVPTLILHGRLDARARLAKLDVPEGYRRIVYVLNGELELGGRPLQIGQSLDLGRSSAPVPALTAGPEGGEFLLLSGQPLDEPVVFGGPFVMNTQTQIQQAYADYETGSFGQIK